MKTKKQRFISGLLAVILIINLIDGRIFRYCWQQLKAYAVASDYEVSFSWDISELSNGADENGLVTNENNKEIRQVTLDGTTALSLIEYANDNPILMTTFNFNLKKSIEKGDLSFTITGLDELIRPTKEGEQHGILELNTQDPNLVSDWTMTRNADGSYTFVNNKRVTSNNQTTFTWQFNSREAFTNKDITLETVVKVTEHEEVQKLDEYDNPMTDENNALIYVDKPTDIVIDTNDLTFHYEAEHDKNEVKIVCESVEDLDVNNLNVNYDWRSYRSVLGLKGLDEMTNSTRNGGVKFGLTRDDFTSDASYEAYLNKLATALGYPSRAELLANNPNYPNMDFNEIYNAHAIAQDTEEQELSQMARGIKTSSYFIEVELKDGLQPEDIMIVDANGNPKTLSSTTVMTTEGAKTIWGFYDYQNQKNERKPGQAYTSVYRVGIKNEKLDENKKEIKLTGHYLVTYQDEEYPVDLTDSAAHTVSREDPQPIGTGNYMNKYNNYEINNEHSYDDGTDKVIYKSHAKPYRTTDQLLYDSIFSGTTVTYRLNGTLPQAKFDDNTTENADGKPRYYDMIYADGAPSIEQLSDSTQDRVLHSDEYDFTRVKIYNLVDGNTVTPTGSGDGFDYTLYIKSNDPSSTDNQWTVYKTGKTKDVGDIYLPSGIDEIQVVVHELGINAGLRVDVDITYNLDEDLYQYVQIDTANNFVVTENGEKIRYPNTNEGTRLVNTFERYRCLDTKNVNEGENNHYTPDKTAIFEGSHSSNTWLRESTIMMDSDTSMTDFKFHDTLNELKAELYQKRWEKEHEELEAQGNTEEQIEKKIWQEVDADIAQQYGTFKPHDYYSTEITSKARYISDTETGLHDFAVYSEMPKGVEPSEGWLDAVLESITVTGQIQGTNENVTAQTLIDSGALSVYYDAATNCIVADFHCEGFALRADSCIDVSFTYPAEISLATARSNSSKNYEVKTYATIFDQNAKLTNTPRELSFDGQETLLVPTSNTPYAGKSEAKAALSSASASVSAFGSQKSNYTTKYVASSYNNWVFDNEAEVDGNNTDHLDGDRGRMTSEYTYSLQFHRLTTDNETVTDPILVDIVEGLRTSNWRGRVKKIHFDETSYPNASYQPEVYYLLDSTDNGVYEDQDQTSDYTKKNDIIMNALSTFQEYGNTTEVSGDTDKLNTDLAVYDNLKTEITNTNGNWKMAMPNADGSWTIDRENVYAIAVLYKGKYIVTNGYLELGAYVDMKAAALTNNTEQQEIINNRATYNEAHVFAKGKTTADVEFPMYSVSDRTLVLMHHKVELVKVSSKTNKRLTGAQFSIFNYGNTSESDTYFANNTSNNNVVKYYTFDKRYNKETLHYMVNMPVNISGALELELSPGIYYYVEEKPPTGYRADTKPYQFRVTTDTDSVYYYTAKFYESTTARDSEYLIVNYDEFESYNAIYGTKNAVENTFPLHLFKQDGNSIAQVDHFTVEGGKYTYDVTANDNVSDIHPVDGVVEFENLPAGTYRLAVNSSDIDSYDFSIADNDTIKFKVLKKSPMSTGLVYNLYERSGSGISANDQLVYFNKTGDGTYTKTGTGLMANDNESLTPESNEGMLSISGLDPDKSYYFTIKEAPVGVRTSNVSVKDIDDTDQVTLYAAEHLEKNSRIIVADDPIETATAEFQKLDGSKYTIKENNIEKYISDYGKPINDAEYNLHLINDDGTESILYFEYDAGNGQYLYNGITPSPRYSPTLVTKTIDGTVGKLKLAGLPYGTYYLQETKAPDGYQLDTTKYFFRVTAQTINDEGKLVFERVAKNEDDAESGSDSSSADSGTDSDTTDTTEESAGEIEITQRNLFDNEILSKIVVNKTEKDDTDKHLENATYQLFRLQLTDALKQQYFTNEENFFSSDEYQAYLAAAKAASQDSKGNTDSENFKQYWGEVIRTSYTDSTGQATFSDLPFGIYLLFERQPPKGYKWNNDLAMWDTSVLNDLTPAINTIAHNQVIVLNAKTVSTNISENISVETDEDGQETIVTVTAYNDFDGSHKDERKEGEARLIKKNENGVGLMDAVYALYQVNLTDAETAALLGKTTEQVQAMTDDEKREAINKKRLTAEAVNIDNHFDTTTGKPKTDANGTIDTVIDSSLRTNGDSSTPGATVTKSGLSWGIYYFYEVTAPVGYQKSTNPYVFVVNEESAGNRIEVEAVDAMIYGEVWLEKRSQKDENGDQLKLFGAKFSLYKNDSNSTQVYSYPLLRLSYTDSSSTLHSKELFLVSNVEVIDKDKMKITLKDGGVVTMTHSNDENGTVNAVTVDNNFGTKYGTVTATGNDFRLSYYAVMTDENHQYTQYYDDTEKRYIEFISTAPEAPDTTGMSQEEAAKANNDYQEKLTAYQNSEKIRQCVTSDYYTADEFGRLNIRGLEWQAYFLRETVPPEGYGLAEDVSFAVNPYNCESQILTCEDPPAQAAIIIDKEIPNADYFKAYGEPTFMFRVYELEETQETTDIAYTKGTTKYKKTGKTYTLPIHLTAPNTTGSVMLNVDEGQYLIEELPVSRYNCYGLELISGTNSTNDKFKQVGVDTPTSYLIYNDDSKYDINTTTGENQWTAFCDLTGGDSELPEIVSFHIKYQNQIERYDNFSEVTFADNKIPGRVYVTSFKPVLSSLIEVYSGTDSFYTYQIDLKTALGNEEFSGILSYNNGETKELKDTDFSHMRFKTEGLAQPITGVSWVPETGMLSVTVNNPSALAGSVLGLDVGYSESSTFNTYNLSDSEMVKGTLNLNFSNIKVKKVKKVTLKNDTSNRSYFAYNANVDPEHASVHDISSVVVIYEKDETNNSITKTMQNNAHTDELKTSTNSNYEFSYWYLLDADGRPVFDTEGKLIQFKDEDAIKAYIYDGTWPSYLTADGANLLPDNLTNPASVENVNSFTFQAGVEKRTPTARFIMKSNTGFLDIIGTNWDKNQMTSFKEGNAEGWEAASAANRCTYDSWTQNRDMSLDNDYPDLIRFYKIGNEVFWYAIDRYTEKPTNGSVYLEYRVTKYDQYSRLFEGYTALTDVSGMFDWDFSGTDLCGYMFNKTKITNFELNRTYKKSGLMYVSRMFLGCAELTTVTMNIDTSQAGNGTEDPYNNTTYISAQTKQMFNDCSKLRELNLSGDFRNLFNAQEMFNGCNSLSASEFQRAFSTWKWNTNNNSGMQTAGNNKGDQIFLSYANVGQLQGVDLIDANGNHYKRNDNKIVLVSLAEGS